MRFKAMLSRVAMRISRPGAAIPWTAHRNSSHRIQYTISATHCESSEGHLSDATRRFSPRFTPFHSGPRPPCRPIMPFRFPPMPFFLAQTPFRSLLTPCCPCPIRSCPCSEAFPSNREVSRPHFPPSRPTTSLWIWKIPHPKRITATTAMVKVLPVPTSFMQNQDNWRSRVWARVTLTLTAHADAPLAHHGRLLRSVGL